MTTELNEKQKRFCQEYIQDYNGAQAAIRAGYSEGTAKEQASRLLTNVNVQEYLSSLQKEQQERTGINADMVIKELAKIAFSDISRVFTADNAIKPMVHIEPEDSAAIQAMDIAEIKMEDMVIGETKKIKMYDKLRALDSLAKHFGIYEKDNKQKETAAVTIFQLPDNGRDKTK